MTRGAFGCLRTRGKSSGGNLVSDLYHKRLDVSFGFDSDLTATPAGSIGYIIKS